MSKVIAALLTLAVLLGLIIALSRVDAPTTIAPRLTPLPTEPYYGDRIP